MDSLIQPFANRPLSPSLSRGYGGGGGGGEEDAPNGEDEVIVETTQNDANAGATNDASPDATPDATPDPVTLSSQVKMSMYNDRPSQMTRGRRLALKLARYAWYNPHVKQESDDTNDNDNDNGETNDVFNDNVNANININATSRPCLNLAWEYFEHFVLPRYLLDDSSDSNGNGSSSSNSGSSDCVNDEDLSMDNSNSNSSIGTSVGPDDYKNNKSNITSNGYNDIKSKSKTNNNNNNKRSNLIRAEQGYSDKQTSLYPLFRTTEQDMSDFGIGVGLYFNTVKYLCIIMFIAGLINVPNLIYFASDVYSGSNGGTSSALVETLTDYGLIGSAVCKNISWQYCNNCSQDDFITFPNTDETRVVTITSTATDNNGNEIDINMNFIKKNNCNINDMFGILSFVTVVFVVLSVYYLNYRQKVKMVSIDETQCTSADYTIEVKNPPNDARDPKEWKQFFESTFVEDDVQVRACTIALDNEELIKALIRRRQLILQLNNMSPKELDSDELEQFIHNHNDPPPLWKKILCCAKSPDAIYALIQEEDVNIYNLSKKVYNVSSVFVTFETEMSQRAVLSALSKSKIIAGASYEYYKFKGVELDVEQTEEPDSIRWQDLNVPLKRRIIEISVTTLVSFALIAGGALLIALGRRDGPELASTIISVCNQITPIVVRILTSYESHPNESSYSASNYIKMTVFRWMNTAVIMAIISPFTDTLRSGSYLIDSVYTMFLFDLALTPGLGLTDIWGNLKRHYFGPRAASQRQMNLWFKASTYDIGEMYTSLTRVFFFTLFYCTIFPAGFFYASAIFFLLYWVGKFNILRTYCQSPQVSATVSKFSNQFLLLCLLFYVVRASYQYAQFPFDNACESEDTVGNEYVGTYKINEDGIEATVEVAVGDKVYNFCEQNLFRRRIFPPIASMQSQDDNSRWMNSSQETFSTIYGWTMVAVFALVSSTLVIWTFIRIVRMLFCKGQKRGDPVPDRFSDLPDVIGYIPQVYVNGYQFPFLLCDIDNIRGNDLLSWDDPVRSYDYWNLIFDVPEVAAMKRREREIDTDDAYVRDSSSVSPKPTISFNDHELVEIEDSGCISEPSQIFSIVQDWDTSQN